MIPAPPGWDSEPFLPGSDRTAIRRRESSGQQGITQAIAGYLARRLRLPRSIASQTMADYTVMIRDLPADERPRERMAAYGPQALRTSELLALLLRSGTHEESVIRLAERLLSHFNSLWGRAIASGAELAQVKGIGPAKAAELMAAFELGKRLAASVDGPRPLIRCPEDVANLVGPEMRYLQQE